MRAIDADALKEDLTRFYDNEVTARKLIDEQPTIQPEPHWIPVTERLPENEKRVLILNDDNLYMIGFIREYDCWNEWRYQYEMYDDDVYEEEEQGKIVAWMPLPEPYKEVTDGRD